MIALIIGSIVLGILFYGMCARLAYKADFAYFQKKYPALAEKNREQDKADARYTACFGPIALLVLLFDNGFKYGFSAERREDQS